MSLTTTITNPRLGGLLIKPPMYEFVSKLRGSR